MLGGGRGFELAPARTPPCRPRRRRPHRPSACHSSRRSSTSDCTNITSSWLHHPCVALVCARACTILVGVCSPGRVRPPHCRHLS